MNSDIFHSFQKLEAYVFEKDYKGYDPYDILNSSLNLNLFGKWGPIVGIQIHKRNPINIRPIIGIKKGINPKAMGLFLKAYSLLYETTQDKEYLQKAESILNWLNTNYTSGYSGKCWGYNFPWASPDAFLPAYTPSVVVTSFVIDGVYEFYKVTNSSIAKKLILSASEYVTKDIPTMKFPQGISYSYTHLLKDCCYNASLLAAEILAKSDQITKEFVYQTDINLAVDLVLSKQKVTGEWLYSLNLATGIERNQIDFHQGFVLNSLYNINNLFQKPREDITKAIAAGLHYYKTKQYSLTGRSYWRIPKKWPTDIHHQAQGIITFSKLKKFNPGYYDFANKIADWTIRNMQSSKGYFYYRKNPLLMNRISYIRWSQAWMMLAFAELLSQDE